jgi:hypothetical protein
MRKRRIADIGQCQPSKSAYLSLNSIGISEPKPNVTQAQHLRFTALVALTAFALLTILVQASGRPRGRNSAIPVTR